MEKCVLYTPALTYILKDSSPPPPQSFFEVSETG